MNTEPVMRKLVRLKATGAFLAPDGTQTTDLAKAGNFASLEAVHAVRANLAWAECEQYYAFGLTACTPYDFAAILP